MVGIGGAKVITRKACSRLLVDITCRLGSSSFRGLQSSDPPMSPATSSFSASMPRSSSNSPFSGLVICVTGLSKEARKQVMDATERLGGEYSPHLHPRCTHLVVQSSGGRKYEHALKHGASNGLFIVTLGWFVDSVRRNVRLSEALYVVKNLGENHKPKDDLNVLASGNSCLPVAMLENAKQPNMIEKSRFFSSEEDLKRRGSIFSGQSFYVDAEVSAELQNKVVEAAFGQGASLADQWLPGHNASHVVCEESSVQKYLGHSNYLVTPLWVLKTVKETRPQRLVHLSADLARQIAMMLDNVEGGSDQKDSYGANGSQDALSVRINSSHEENQNKANLAKKGVRNRRGRQMQTCQAPIKPLTPTILLDSICWSISEPSSSASIYTDSFTFEDAKASTFVDASEDGKESNASFVNFSRPLSEAEKNDLIFKNHFLTILFPVDRFSEMGPGSRTFFSDSGFTCLQLLDHIYAFYQENMSKLEIELAIHTDSRHADQLRSVYASKEAAERGYVEVKRIELLGSRKSLEMLKRVPGDNNSNVYELLTRA